MKVRTMDIADRYELKGMKVGHKETLKIDARNLRFGRAAFKNTDFRDLNSPKFLLTANKKENPTLDSYSPSTNVYSESKDVDRSIVNAMTGTGQNQGDDPFQTNRLLIQKILRTNARLILNEWYKVLTEEVSAADSSLRSE